MHAHSGGTTIRLVEFRLVSGHFLLPPLTLSGSRSSFSLATSVSYPQFRTNQQPGHRSPPASRSTRKPGLNAWAAPLSSRRYSGRKIRVRICMYSLPLHATAKYMCRVRRHVERHAFREDGRAGHGVIQTALAPCEVRRWHRAHRTVSFFPDVHALW